MHCSDAAPALFAAELQAKLRLAKRCFLKYSSAPSDRGRTFQLRAGGFSIELFAGDSWCVRAVKATAWSSPALA
jgi:hypothetical protein